jgi:hypothetical protein
MSGFSADWLALRQLLDQRAQFGKCVTAGAEQDPSGSIHVTVARTDLAIHAAELCRIEFSTPSTALSITMTSSAVMSSLIVSHPSRRQHRQR